MATIRGQLACVSMCAMSERKSEGYAAIALIFSNMLAGVHAATKRMAVRHGGYFHQPCSQTSFKRSTLVACVVAAAQRLALWAW